MTKRSILFEFRLRPHYYHRIQYKMEGKTKVFNGNGDVKEFITKVELYSALKGYSGEKSAQNLASKLEGRAFDVYLRLSEGDRKDVNIIKDELLKEFERGQLNREEALFTLSKRSRNLGESANTYAYKLMELVKLAYPDFDDTTRATLAKDYFVRGLHLDMQIALKSMEKFTDSNIDTLAVETTRLQLAGIQSRFEERSSTNAINVNNASATMPAEVLDSIAEKVVEKLTKTSLNPETGSSESYPPEVNFTTNMPNYSQRGFRGGYRNQRRQSRYRGASRGRSENMPARQLKCRCCQSTDHLVRNCPARFCQACGQRGHDSRDQTCPKYQ